VQNPPKMRLFVYTISPSLPVSQFRSTMDQAGLLFRASTYAILFSVAFCSPDCTFFLTYTCTTCFPPKNCQIRS